MRIVFLDSDILLDVILIRLPHYSLSAQVLDLTAKSDYTLCTTVHGLLNIHYITKKQIGLENADKAIKLLLEKLHIVTEDKLIADQAINSLFTAFEDAVQYFAALGAKAEVIITRNIKDYTHSTIPVLTAEQFLRTIL
jgi:predicted nucleic acid-binding protein